MKPRAQPPAAEGRWLRQTLDGLGEDPDATRTDTTVRARFGLRRATWSELCGSDVIPATSSTMGALDTPVRPERRPLPEGPPAP
jgi:hypothetical protein